MVFFKKTNRYSKVLNLVTVADGREGQNLNLEEIPMIQLYDHILKCAAALVENKI
eukprot:SAG31_NODE_1139_length_9713_cov_28.936863_9_plen_55_part_00